MNKYHTPLKEIDNTIGILYELSLQSNLKLTESVNNLRITIGNLMSAETKVKDIVVAQQVLENKYKLIASI